MGKNNAVTEEANRLKTKLSTMELEIGRMKETESRVEELENNRQNYGSDVEKLGELIAKLQKHTEGLDKKIEARKVEFQSKQETLTSLKAEKDGLDEELEKQEVTPLEVQEMGHQRAMLKETLSSLDEQKENTKREIWDLEMKISKKQSGIDLNVKKFNNLALEVELIPSTAKHANGADLELAVNTLENSADAMVNLDLTNTIKPTLQALAEDTQKRIMQEQTRQREALLQRTHSMDKKQEKDEQVANLQARLKKSIAQIKKERGAAEKDLQKRMTVIQEVESRLGKLNSEQRLAVGQSESDLKAMDNAMTHLLHMQTEEKERVCLEIKETCEKVVQHKMAVTELLKTLSSGLTEHRNSLLE